MKKIERKTNTQTTYSTQDELDQDLRPGRQRIKRVDPASQSADLERTRNTGETKKTYPVRGVNDPS